MENNYCVYKHTTPNGKVYIGITRRKPQIRWGINGTRYKNNKHFYNAIQKYGWNKIKHEILYDGLDSKMAESYEKFFIFVYDSANREHGYNNTFGGEHGKMANHVNEENRKRGRLLVGEKNPFYGKKHSEDTKRHLSEVRLNNPNRFEQSRKAGLKSKEKFQKRVAQYDLEGNYIATFDCFSDAALSVAGDKGGGNHIGSVCRGERNTAYGYKWKYA